MNQQVMNKSDLKGLLKEFVVTVVFTKTDGTERILRGTLKNEYLPTHTDWDNISDSRQSDNVVAIWDLENNGWRSFRLDSIKQLSIAF